MQFIVQPMDLIWMKLHTKHRANCQAQWVTPFSLNPQNPKTFIIGYNDVL